MRSAVWALVAIAAVSGCKIRKVPPGGFHDDAPKVITVAKPIGTPEERAQLRAEVLARVKPFADRPEYAVTDPEFVEPCLDNELRFLGRMPTADERAEVVRSGRVCVSNALGDKDGLAAIAKRIAERYAHPVITREGDVVRIDAGVVAGKLAAFRAKTIVSESPYLDVHREWKTSEVVRMLTLAMHQHPDAHTYSAEVDVLSAMDDSRWTYVYDRRDDRIRVFSSSEPNRHHVTDALGGDVGTAVSLSTWSLKRE